MSAQNPSASAGPASSAGKTGQSGWSAVTHEDDPVNAGGQPGAHGDASAARAFDAIVKRIPTLRDPQDPLKLTPLRAHYLKKALIKLQVQAEVEKLNQQDALSTLGPPFRPSPNARSTDLPILRYLFHHFVLTFPFLRSAPPNFFADKVQLFIERFLERNISGTDDREEASKRRKIANKLEKYVVLLFGSALRVKAAPSAGANDAKAGASASEEVIKIAESDRKRIAAAELRMRAIAGGNTEALHSFDVNVVSVRAVTTKGRIRSRVHEAFLIRTRHGHVSSNPPSPTADASKEKSPRASNSTEEVYVSRRYGDFVRLADTLRLEFPDEDVRPPPAKDRRKVDYQQRSPALTAQGAQAPNAPPLELPEARTSSENAAGSGIGGTTVVREKNRLTLRAYLRSLLAVPALADSSAMQDFLTKDPTTLSDAEKRDAVMREELDAVREEEAARFAEESNKRVAELQEHLNKFKADLIQADGLTRIFATIKATPNMHDLPKEYLALVSWARISAASTLFHMFMGSDTSSEVFAQLKRIHGLMPYFVLRGILRISNPVAMIRGGLDLFLAQPFGQKSLIQRMFSSGLQEDVNELAGVCASVEEKVADELLCDKVIHFTELTANQQAELRRQAKEEKLDLITVILRGDECGAQLNPLQVDRVVRASREYELYKAYRSRLSEDDEDEGPQNEEAWLYEDLHVLLRCSTRLRDKQQTIELIFEGVTAELLKDMVTIFYTPLAQVYKAANIADSLSDLQAFINDLIRTVEASEELSYTNPQATVQVFMNLVERHEARFYNFVYQVHSKGSGLFDGLMHWIELFVNFVRGSGTSASVGERQGIGAVDLEVCLPAGKEARTKVMHEIDQLVVYAYRRKLLREIKLRRRLAEKEVEAAADKLLNKGMKAGAGLGSDAAFVEAVVDNLGVGDMFTGEMEDAEAELDDEDETDEEEEEDEEEDAEGTRGPKKRTASIDSDDSAAQRERAEARRAKSLKAQKPVPPELKVVPDMLPTFIEMVRPLLRPARSASGSLLRSNSYDVFQNEAAGQGTWVYGSGDPAANAPQQQQQSWGSWLMGSRRG